MKLTAIILAMAALSGCSALNNHGIGGTPVLACSFRDAKAFIDDRLLGSDELHVSVARRFTDGDSLCVVKPAR